MILRRFNVLILTGIMVLSCSLVFAGEGSITLVYTNSLNGNIDYCHCGENPNGGLVKRATELKKIRRELPNVILVETGDFFPYEKDPLLAKYLLFSYRHMGYDAIIPGDQEFNSLGELVLNSRGLPLIVNNIIIRGGRPTRGGMGRHVVIQRGGLTVGIIGTIAPSAFRFYPKSIAEKFKVLNQAAEIRKDVEQLKSIGADVILLLSHSGFENDIALEKEITGVEVIVGGHTQTLINKPVRGNRALIVQAGSNGAHIGILEMTIKNGKIISFKNSFRRPDEFRPPDDPVIRKFINDYKKETGKKYKDLKF